MSLRQIDRYAADTAIVSFQRIDAGIEAELHPGARRMFGHGAGIQMHIAGFVRWAITGPGQRGGDAGQCRLDARQLIAADDVFVHAQLAHLRGHMGGLVQLTLGMKQGHDATGLLLVIQIQFGAQHLQGISAVAAQRQHLAHIAFGTAATAFQQELPAPAPLGRVQPQAEQ